MDKFGFPTNIKQIGNIDETLRIYMEENVYSYLMKYAQSNVNSESSAVLIGRCMIIDGQTVLFINGAIQALYTETKNGIINFTDKTNEYVEEQKNKYFRGLEVVGWLLSQPNFGNFLSSAYSNYHMQVFDRPYQVLFVSDPVEKIHTFFTWNESKTDIQESEGFFIYYDRNNDMKRYADDNKIVEYILQENIEQVIEDEKESEKEEETIKIVKPNNVHNIDRAKSKKSQSKPNYQQAKVVNLLLTISALLFVTSFILGTGLVKNDSRLETVELELKTMRTAYNNLVTYLNEEASATVFASESVQYENEEAPVAENTTDSYTVENGETIQTEEVATEATTEVVTQITEPQVTEPVTQPVVTTEPQTTIVTRTDIPDSYIIQQGDSLISISTYFYGTKDMQYTIMELNNITDPDKIYHGMVLKLPK